MINELFLRDDASYQQSRESPDNSVQHHGPAVYCLKWQCQRQLDVMGVTQFISIIICDLSAGFS